MINFKQIVAATEIQRANIIESFIKNNLSKIEDAIWDAAKEGKYEVAYCIEIPSFFKDEEGEKDIINILSDYLDNFELILIPSEFRFMGYILHISWYKKEED